MADEKEFSVSHNGAAILRALLRRLNIRASELPTNAEKAAEHIQIQAQKLTFLCLYPDGWDFSRGRTPEPLALVAAFDPRKTPMAEWGYSVPTPGGDPEWDCERGTCDTLSDAMAMAERIAKALADEVKARKGD